MNRQLVVALTEAVPADLIREVFLPTTNMTSCRTICCAESLADAGMKRIIITGRMINEASVRRLPSLAARTQIVAVIDHFRHAELLSQCLRQNGNRTGSEIQVLIEVDLGRQSTGVCPGPDITRLAAATAHLPGLKVVGVFAAADQGEVGSKADSFDDGHSSTVTDPIVTVAEHALRSIREVAADCREIVVKTSSVGGATFFDDRVTSLIVSPFLSTTKLTIDPILPPSVTLISTVISRPTLEWCVVDVGTMILGGAADVYVHAPSGAIIQHSTDDTSTLLLSGEAIDMRIGDTVELAMQNPERLLRGIFSM